MDKIDKLEACRFCGKESKGHWDGPYVHVSGAPDTLQFYSIVCNGCCSTASYESREAAIAKWNSRASVAAPPPDVEQWKTDLGAAGWLAESATAWRAPDGSLWRGPFGAWKELQRRRGLDFNDLLPLAACRVAPGEYDIKSRNGRVLWRMEGAALADWICASVNGYDAAVNAIRSPEPSPVAAPVDVETVRCPVCKDEVPEDSMFSYNNVPNAFCQGCVDSGKV